MSRGAVADMAAKPKAKPVKVYLDVYDMLVVISNANEVDIQDYVSEKLRPLIVADYRAAAAKIARKAGVMDEEPPSPRSRK